LWLEWEAGAMANQVELSQRKRSGSGSSYDGDGVEITAELDFEDELDEDARESSQHATLLRHGEKYSSDDGPGGGKASDSEQMLQGRKGKRRLRNKVLHLIFLALGPLVFFVLCFVQRGKALPTAGLLFWVALWWITEITPLGYSAFIPAIILPMLGVCTPKEVTACYLNPTIMLFIQSFLLASSVHKYNLHKRIALNVLLVTGTKPGGILLGSIFITAFLSMWMSNTATSAMMVPLVMTLYESLFDKQQHQQQSDSQLPDMNSLPAAPNSLNGRPAAKQQHTKGIEVQSSIIDVQKEEGEEEERDNGGGYADTGEYGRSIDRFGQGLMLSVAYSASIGGTATLIGTGPNLILMQTWETSFGTSLDFLSWLGFGVIYAGAMLVVLWVYLWLFFTSSKLPRATSSQLRILLKELGPYSWPEKVVTGCMLMVMFFWLTRRKPLLGWGEAMQDATGASVHDYMPVMLAAIVLSIVPEKNPFSSRNSHDGRSVGQQPRAGRGGGKILDTRAFSEVSWDVVFLLGGGIALSLGIQKSGLMEYIEGGLTYLREHVSRFVLPLLITTVTTFATEFVSNVAMSSIMLPLLATLGSTSANLALIPATLACSCAFMLPSATPPNALAYGSGLLKVFPDMVTSGLFMNLVGIGLITFCSIFIAPLFFPENTAHL
jgi:sodium-dependent dicarboxylate transporter 2/3/5